MKTISKRAMSIILMFAMVFSLFNFGNLGSITAVYATPASQTYTQDFSSATSSFSAKLGAASTTLNRVAVTNNAFKIVGKSGSTPDIKAIFTDSPDVANGEMQADFVLPAGDVSFGFVFRYKDESNYAAVMYTDTAATKNKWELHGTTANLNSRSNTPITQTAFPASLSHGVKYSIKIDYDTGAASHYSIYLKKATDPTFTLLANISSDPVGSPAVYTGAGKLALRINYVSTDKVDPIYVDNIIEKDNSGNTVYTRNFNSEDTASAPANMQYKNNKSETLLTLPSTSFTPNIAPFTLTPNDAVSYLTAVTAGTDYIIDDASPSLALGSFSANVSGTSSDYGLVFNYADNSHFNMIKYNSVLSKWELVTTKGGAATIITGGFGTAPPPSVTTSVYTNVYTNLKVDYSSSNNLVFYVNGMPYSLGNQSANLYIGDGKVGVATGVANYLQVDDVSLTYTPESTTAVTTRIAPDPTNFQTISSSDMKVLVGTDFPFVYKYKDTDNNSITNGIRESEAVKQMNINGVNVAVTSSLTSIASDTATYKLNAVDVNNHINATFTVTLKIIGNKLRMEFPSIIENAGTVVRSFYIPNHNMLSVQGSGAGAAVGQLTGWGPMADYFVNIDAISASKTTSIASYVMLYDSAYAQSIENNAMDGKRKYSVKEYLNPADPDDKYVSVTNNAWYWHYLDNVPLDTDYVPFAQVVIGGDQNNDAAIDWQDAGLLYRTIANQAFGSQDIKNNWLYIAMNMSSQSSNPFVRVLDRGKAIAYLTDGFGQKIMNKGYQAGGHDDSHGDYDNVGVQQGGAKDFNYLNEIGKLYHIKTGIHINATEFALDGFDTKLENLTQNTGGGLKPNWNWLDQAWLVDKTKDVQSGELKRRLDQLKATVPGLNFVYVDVYQSGSDFNAKRFAKYMNDNGWSVGTEAAGDFEEALTFVHWNTDLYYPSGGSQSQVIRFVQNDVADKFAPDKALLGSLMPGIADWRNTNKFSDAQDVFYRENLPTKYLQHFTLQKWTPNVSAQFSGNVQSVVTNENGKDYCNIYKNNILIAKIDVSAVITDYSSKPQPSTPGKSKIFIPWSPETEEKIYYYNDYETSSTWTLPNSWAGVTKAYQYQLTPGGRVLMGTVDVVNNSVTVNGNISTPYLLTKTADTLGNLPDPTGNWDQGSEIANFGFTSGTLEGWNTAVTAGNPTGINILTNSGNEGNYNDPMVSFNTDVTGSLSQTLTGLTPGKTYSISAWTRTDDRPVTLGVLINGQRYENTIKTTAGIPIMMKPSKYLGKNYQRLKVDFTVPTKVTTAQVYFNADAGTGNQAVYVDDFRSWEWPNVKPSFSNAYVVHEDFENVDENWGPFISQVGTQPYIHLTETNTNTSEQSQIKKYSIDGNISLKNQQTGSGVHMRTLPSTLNLKPNSSYTVSFDYQAYREMRTSGEYATGPVTYNAANNGFSVPERATMYSLELRNASGVVINSIDLTPSAVSTPYSYNSAVATQVCTFDIAADGLDGKYITISKKSASTDDMLVIDNFYVLDTSDRTAPMTTDNAPNGWINQDTTVNLSASDSGSGVANTYYTVDDGVEQTGDSIVFSTEGAHKLTYWSMDRAGNIETAKTTPVMIDKAAPVSIAAISPSVLDGNNGWYKSDITVSLSVNDNLSGVAKTEYQVNDGAWINYSGSIPAFINDGVYKVNYRSVDRAGNIEPIQTIEFKIDKTAPSLIVELDKTSIWPANHKMVNLNVNLITSDTTSGVDSIVLTSITSNEQDSGQGDIQANIGTTDTSFRLRAERSGQSTGRIYTITYTATDKAGNKTISSAIVTVPHDQSGNPK